MNVKKRARGARTLFWSIALGAVVGGPGCGGAPQPAIYKPVADVKQLMQAMIEPAADALWDKSGFIATAAGIEKRHPKNDEEWTAARNHAITITEAANLLMMPPRARDAANWMKGAERMRQQGEAMWRAADAKDVDELFTVGMALYESCAFCHEHYVDEIADARR